MVVKLFLIRFFDRFYPSWSVKMAAKLFATPRRIPRPPYEEELIKTGERMTFKCGLVAYKFGKGSPVLLIHGWEGRGTQLGHFVEPLIKRGFSVYAVDGPGHGESPGTELTPTLYATFIKSLGLELGPIQAIIAHSFGTGSSALVAHDCMDMQKLVLIAGPDRYAKVVDNFCNLIKMSSHVKSLFYDEVTRKVGMHPDQMQVSLIAKKLKPALMLVHDEDDKSVSFEASVRIHEAAPGSELLATKGLGHRRILKDDAVIEKVCHFITKS